MKKTALVVGATGLVGKALTQQLLKNPNYEQVRVLVRKSLPIIHPNLEQVILDFEQPNPEQVQGDDVFCCLGTTIRTAGSKEAFRRVDFEYPLTIAKLALQNGAKQYALVTAMGADKESFFFYNQVKGQTEEAIAELNYSTFLIFRPSMLLGERAESRLGEKIGKVLMQVLDFFIPKKYKAVEAAKVAEAMIAQANSGFIGRKVMESDEIYG